MAKTDLLKEAIADAKAVKETAIANAKIALEEAFGNRLQSMLGKQLAEQLDEEDPELDLAAGEEAELGAEEMDDMEMGDEEMDDMEPEMDYPQTVGVGLDFDLDGQYDLSGELGMADDEEMDDMEPGMDDMEMDDMEMGDEEMDSELDMELEEIIKELEEGIHEEGMQYEEEMNESPIDVWALRSNKDAIMSLFDEGLSLSQKIAKAKKISVDLSTLSGALDTLLANTSIVQAFMPSKVGSLIKNDVIQILKAVFPTQTALVDIVVKKILNLAKKLGVTIKENVSPEDIDSLIESILAEDDAEAEAEYADETLKEGKKCAECGSKNCKCESRKSAKELKEAYSVIKQLRYTINEVNLLNAKLLYTNKLFRNFELNDSQKMKVIENFDRAASTREVKLVFSTLSESFKKPVNKKKVVKESKSYASRPTTSTAPKREIISEGAAFANRWKKLAGLI